MSYPMMYKFLIMVMDKVSKIAFSHVNLSYMLATKYLWWLLMNGSQLEAHCQLACLHFTVSFHHTAPPHIKCFRSGQLLAFFT